MPTFLDFEASSLNAESWPIEIGLATTIDNKVYGWGSLIKPADHWPEDDWNPASEAVHGIKRDELNNAPSAYDVADEFLRRIEPFNFHCFSDNPSWEAKWLGRLLEAHPSKQKITIEDFDLLVGARYPRDQVAWERIYRFLDKNHIPHRADKDAVRLATAFLKGAGE